MRQRHGYHNVGFWFAAATLVVLSAVNMGGCQPQTPPPDDPPPGQDLTVEVTIAPADSGRVEQDADGPTVKLTAIASEGFEFDSWSGADVGADQNPLTVDARDVASITANFADITEPPPGSGDADSDGVLNSADQCPGTRADAVVDAQGCADSQGIP